MPKACNSKIKEMPRPCLIITIYKVQIPVFDWQHIADNMKSFGVTLYSCMSEVNTKTVVISWIALNVMI